jgi:hypothetical protein
MQQGKVFPWCKHPVLLAKIVARPGPLAAISQFCAITQLFDLYGFIVFLFCPLADKYDKIPTEVEV